jgi:hypothetical protein
MTASILASIAWQAMFTSLRRDGVGFCAYALCLSKPARLQSVHLYQWQMCAQSAFKPAVVSALNPAGQLLNDIIFPSLMR